jgi:hypothetical protein
VLHLFPLPSRANHSPSITLQKKLWKKHADRPTDLAASTTATATTQPRRASAREKESVNYDEDAPVLTAPLVFLQHTDANSGLTAREENLQKVLPPPPPVLLALLQTDATCP